MMAGRGNLNYLTPELLKRKVITKEYFSHPLKSENIRKMVSGHQCFGRKIYISADLTVYPCVMERRFSHGNLKYNSLEKILRQDIMSFNKTRIETCSGCEFRYACHDCRPDSITNDIYAKPYYCTYDVEHGCWLDADEFVKDFFNED